MKKEKKLKEENRSTLLNIGKDDGWQDMFKIKITNLADAGTTTTTTTTTKNTVQRW